MDTVRVAGLPAATAVDPRPGTRTPLEIVIPGYNRDLDAMTDISQLETHRAALTGHCYRMLGSVVDADDAVQETMIRAWRGLGGFDGRSQLGTWLYRIATNVCLDELRGRARRVRPVEEGPAGTIDGDLAGRPREYWVEPIADSRALAPGTGPAESAILRQSIRLAFVAALQRLPPRQRAVLILSDVLDWRAAEIAETLRITSAAVNSALQRARASMSSRGTAGLSPVTEEQRRVAERYAEAFERYDVDAIVTMLHREATLSMPPYSLWLRGPEAIRAWLLGRGAGCRGSRLIPVSACGSPAFGQYRRDPAGGFTPWALIVLEMDGARVLAWNAFLDTQTLFPRFDLPARLDPEGR